MSVWQVKSDIPLCLSHLQHQAAARGILRDVLEEWRLSPLAAQPCVRSQGTPVPEVTPGTDAGSRGDQERTVSGDRDRRLNDRHDDIRQ